MRTHPVHNGLCRGPGREDLRDAHPLQLRDIGVRDDAAAEHHHVVGATLAEQVDGTAEQRHVRAGQHGQSDRVGVLLDGGLHDLLGRLVQPGVDDFHAGVAQRPRDHLGAPVVAVQARLGDDDANP